MQIIRSRVTKGGGNRLPRDNVYWVFSQRQIRFGAVDKLIYAYLMHGIIGQGGLWRYGDKRSGGANHGKGKLRIEWRGLPQ